MIRRHGVAIRVTLMAADLLSAAVLFALVAQLRFGGAAWGAIIERTATGPWLAALTYAAAWIFVLWIRGLYRMRARLSLRREAADIVAAAVILAFATFAFLFLVKLSDVSRLFLLVLFPAQALLTLLIRAGLREAFERARKRGHNTRYVLVAGTGEDAQSFADRLEAHRELGLVVIGHLSEPTRSKRVVTRPILGRLDDIETILHRNVVDEVAICLPWQAWSLVEPVTRLCEEEGKVVRIPVGAFGLPTEGGIVEDFDGEPILSFVYGPDRALSLAVKRLMDVVFAAAGLIVLSPVLLVVAAAIRRSDGAPVLFRQQRIGLQGRPFTLLKLRTMLPDAEHRLSEVAALNEIEGAAFKLTDDPRLTRTGGFLRRTSLDELPQLWNVLRGEMSLVGPRPPLPDEVGSYDVWHRRRLSMKPGITGLWQIEGRREPRFDRWVEMDLDYIDRWSLWLDVRILLRTIPALLSQEGR